MRAPGGNCLVAPARKPWTVRRDRSDLHAGADPGQKLGEHRHVINAAAGDFGGSDFQRLLVDGRCCTSLTTEDSLCESMRLDARYEQAISHPLLHDELVQLQRIAAEAGIAADPGRQGHDLARAT